MAEKKGLGSLAAAASSLASRLPFLAKKPAASPEPFSAIEDETPLGDLLSSSNVAPGLAKEAPSERPDLKDLAVSAVGAAIRKPYILVSVIVVLALLAALAVTSLIVTTPPKASAAPAPFSESGEALLKTWLPPPGDPLEARMPMEREGAPVYSPDDAARLGIDPALSAHLRAMNDAEMDKLLGAAP